jgi:hypothetical protein
MLFPTNPRQPPRHAKLHAQMKDRLFKVCPAATALDVHLLRMQAILAIKPGALACTVCGLHVAQMQSNIAARSSCTVAAKQLLFMCENELNDSVQPAPGCLSNTLTSAHAAVPA